MCSRISNMGIICMMLVVPIHIQAAGTEGSFGWWFNALIRNGIAKIAVPYFFIISGYFLAAHFGELDFWGREVKKRFSSLVIPFFVWSLITFALYSPLSIVADYLAHRPFGASVQISNGRWIHTLGLDFDNTPLLTPLWYIRCLFIFVLLSPIFKFLVRRLGRLWLLIAYALYLGDSLWPYDCAGLKGFFHYGFSLSRVFYFSVGIFIRNCAEKYISRLLAICCLGVGLVVMLCGIVLKVPNGLAPLFVPFLLCGTFCLIPAADWPRWFTTSAFPIFLMHCIVLVYVETILGALKIKGDLVVTPLWLSGVAVPICLARVIAVHCPSMAQLLFGGRVPAAK